MSLSESPKNRIWKKGSVNQSNKIWIFCRTFEIDIFDEFDNDISDKSIKSINIKNKQYSKSYNPHPM